MPTFPESYVVATNDNIIAGDHNSLRRDMLKVAGGVTNDSQTVGWPLDLYYYKKTITNTDGVSTMVTNIYYDPVGAPFFIESTLDSDVTIKQFITWNDLGFMHKVRRV